MHKAKTLLGGIYQGAREDQEVARGDIIEYPERMGIEWLHTLPGSVTVRIAYRVVGALIRGEALALFRVSPETLLSAITSFLQSKRSRSSRGEDIIEIDYYELCKVLGIKDKQDIFGSLICESITDISYDDQRSLEGAFSLINQGGQYIVERYKKGSTVTFTPVRN